MARTTKTDEFIPDVFMDAVSGAFAQKNAFVGSALASLGVVAISDTLSAGPSQIGDVVKVPYFGTIGDFVQNNTDGNTITPVKVASNIEQNNIQRRSLAFEVTNWASLASAPIGGGDPYEEAARQVVVSGQRAMDDACIQAALATGVLAKSYFSSTTPQYISYDMFVDSKFAFWNDEQEDVVAMAVHSKTAADLLKLKDAAGHPLLTNITEGTLPRFLGLPIVISDRLPVTGSSMGAVTSAGTTPPVITLSGTPLGAFDLRIKATLGGALATWKLQFSTDGGATWSADITSAASVPLTDTAADSLVGINGATGITAAIAAGTANVDNTWASKAILKARSLLLKRRSCAFWFDRKGMELLTDKDILVHSRIGAMHMYYVAHRYRRLSGGTKPGIVAIDHNVSNFIG